MITCVVPRELERINGIVERLLELARPARLSFALVRLPELVERAVELYTDQLADRHIEVVREYARDVPPVQADNASVTRLASVEESPNCRGSSARPAKRRAARPKRSHFQGIWRGLMRSLPTRSGWRRKRAPSLFPLLLNPRLSSPIGPR